jgi:hypothetical protein
MHKYSLSFVLLLSINYISASSPIGAAIAVGRPLLGNVCNLLKSAIPTVGQAVVGGAVQVGTEQFLKYNLSSEEKSDTIKGIIQLAQENGAMKAELLSLAAKIDKCVTVSDLQAALYQHSKVYDEKFQEIAKQFFELKMKEEMIMRDLSVVKGDISDIRRDLSGLRDDVRNQRAMIGENRVMIYNLQDELNKIIKWSPIEQSERLGIMAFEHYWKGEFDSALSYFRYAHAYDREDPSPLFAMGLCYYRQNKIELAEQMIAYGIAANRFRTPAAWYANSLERVQGEPRKWLDDRRNDPVLGVKSSGSIRLTIIEADKENKK